MQPLLQDVRFGLRQILRNPGLSLTAILSLTLGIGATVAVYSILYDAVLNPWPYAGMNRICQVWMIDKSGQEGMSGLTGPQIRQLRQTHAVEDVVGVDGWNLTVTGSDVPEDVQAIMLTGSGFQFLGMPAMLGRYFLPSDAPDGQDPQPVAVLSYKFWQRHYRGDPSIVGKTIQLTHRSYTILGVMPPRFTWMDGDVYLPLKMASDQVHGYGIIFKLKPGVSPQSAEAEFRPLYQQFNRDRPNVFPKDFKISVRRLADNYVRSLKKTMYLLFGAVALLLAIGCGNLSILLLARGTAREHEFAIRSALGASGVCIVRQLLTESLLLSVTGAGLGVLLAWRAIDLIVPRLPDHSYPYEADFHINTAVLCFSIVMAVVSGVLFGLFPALQSARPQISQAMQAGTRRLTGSVKGRRIHTALIASQIALTLLLMTAAGAAIQGFVRMMRVPLGYDPQHVMSVGIPLHENTHNTWEDRVRFFALLRDKIAVMPGVVAAGISTNATPPGSGFRTPVEILGLTASETQEAHVEMISPEYFTALRIPLIAGRIWNQSEVMRGATLVLVNQAFVRRYLSGANALGRSVRIPRLTNEPPFQLSAPGSSGWLQVIGVVGDSLDDGLDKPVAPAVYAPYTLVTWLWTQVLVRTQGEPLAMLHSIQLQIASIDPDQQTIGTVRDLEGWIEREPEYARARLVSMLFGAFSGLALILAAVGLYSVVSYTVAQRTSELGIRVALGAQARDVLRVVASSAATSVGLGILSGLVLSFALNRLIAQWIENGTRDPVVVLLSALLLLAVAFLAALVPARRALGISPIEALRYQ